MPELRGGAIVSSNTEGGSFFSLLGAIVAGFFAVAILIRQMLFMAFRLGGYTGVGLTLALIAAVLFGIHIWLDEAVPRAKYRYGR